MTFNDVKDLVEHYVGLERDALHIHAALLLYLLAMFVFRATRRSRIPWLFVLGIELANEAYDLWLQTVQAEPPRWNDSLKDVWNTMLWPTVLLFIGRYTDVFHHRSHPPVETEEGANSDARGARWEPPANHPDVEPAE
jgi:hypothetical protein